MSNISEYSIINTKEIEEDLKEAKESLKIAIQEKEYDDINYCETEIRVLKEILNNCISLEKTLKQIYKLGNDSACMEHEDIEAYFERDVKNLTIKK